MSISHPSVSFAYQTKILKHNDLSILVGHNILFNQELQVTAMFVTNNLKTAHGLGSPWIEVNHHVVSLDGLDDGIHTLWIRDSVLFV